jgi:hypothetical protein
MTPNYKDTTIKDKDGYIKICRNALIDHSNDFFVYILIKY